MSDTGCGTTQKTGTQLSAFADLYRDISTKFPSLPSGPFRALPTSSTKWVALDHRLASWAMTSIAGLLSWALLNTESAY